MAEKGYLLVPEDQAEERRAEMAASWSHSGEAEKATGQACPATCNVVMTSPHRSGLPSSMAIR
jgi:hypothetical protein